MMLAVVRWVGLGMMIGWLSAWGEPPPAKSSPLAQTVWKEAGSRWVSARRSGFDVFGHEAEQVRRAQLHIQRTWKHLDDLFGADPTPGPIRIFLIADTNLWARVLRADARRRDSLALQMGNELFVRWEGSMEDGSWRLAHELVHLRLWRRYGDRVPLWIDEGLATYLAEQIVPGHRMDIPIGMSPAVVQRATSPDEVTPAFYRSAARMVGVVERRSGSRALVELVEAAVRDKVRWEDFLASRLGASEAEIAEFSREVEGGRNVSDTR